MNARIFAALKTHLFFAIAAAVSPPIFAQTSPTKAPEVEAASAPPIAAPAAKAARPGIVKVGDEMKETLGRITDLDKGDNGCFLILRNDRNGELIELGKMEFCSQKQLKGKKVELEYKMETIQAASCYGDAKCKKTETVPLVVGVKVLD